MLHRNNSKTISSLEANLVSFRLYMEIKVVGCTEKCGILSKMKFSSVLTLPFDISYNYHSSHSVNNLLMQEGD